MPEKGDHIGKYIVIRCLGSGGDGAVYLCAHRDTWQLWAMKLMPRGRGRDAYREVSALRGLHHPSLPLIADVWETDEYLVLIMEYVRGKNAAQILKDQGTFTRRQWTDLAGQLAEAIAYLHAQSPPVCHLDIKPANIICSMDNRIVLVDFGAAWLKDYRQDIRKGTEGYLPEEALRSGKPPDERWDIYGYGATLYEVITGEHYAKAGQPLKDRRLTRDMVDFLDRCTCFLPGRQIQDGQALAASWKENRRIHAVRTRRIRLLLAVWLSILTLYPARKALRISLSHIQGTSLELAAEQSGKAVAEMSLSREKEPETQGIDIFPDNSTEMPAFETDRMERDTLKTEEKLGWEIVAETSEAVDIVKETETDLHIKSDAGISIDQFAEKIDLYIEDSLLSRREDEELRLWLYDILPEKQMTVLEWYAENPAEYGRLCCMLGCAYYFFYEDQDAARQISGEWFDRAVNVIPHISLQESWMDTAILYQRLCRNESLYAAKRVEQWEAERLGIASHVGDTQENRLDQLDELMREGIYGEPGSALRLRQWQWLAEELTGYCTQHDVSPVKSRLMDMADRMQQAFAEDAKLAGLEGNSEAAIHFHETVQTLCLLTESKGGAVIQDYAGQK